MIVRARPEQAGALTGIAIAAKRHWAYPETWIQTWLPALTVSAGYLSENETWLALRDEEPVAWYSLKDEANKLWLDNLWVLPEYMGRGIGKELFGHAIERSRMRGAGELLIAADPNAQSFYEHVGARKISEHHSGLFGEDRVLPILEIKL